MKLGWLGKAVALLALDQIGKALEARRARRSAKETGDSGDEGGNHQPADDRRLHP